MAATPRPVDISLLLTGVHRRFYGNLRLYIKATEIVQGGQPSACHSLLKLMPDFIQSHSDYSSLCYFKLLRDRKCIGFERVYQKTFFRDRKSV